MPELDPQPMRDALARRGPQTFAEKSQTAMLEPINRYKTSLGRAATPEMLEAVRRSELANSVEVSG